MVEVYNLLPKEEDINAIFSVYTSQIELYGSFLEITMEKEINLLGFISQSFSQLLAFVLLPLLTN